MPGAADTKELLQRPMVAQAVKDLLRRMRADGLKAGDKLPPQSALRSADGRGAGTLDAAMAILVAHGVLSRKRKVGTVVEDPGVAIPGLWTVGYAYVPEDIGPVPYSTLLSALLQSELALRGYTLRVYPRRQHQIHVPDRLAGFAQLATEIASGDLDALVTTADLDHRDLATCTGAGIPVVHCGHCHAMPCAALFDRERWQSDALGWLRAAGAARIHLVYNYGPQDGARDQHWTAMAQLFGGTLPRIHARGNGHQAGIAIAGDLLALPAAERPDGLLVTDDRIASGLSLRLATAGAYRPKLAVLGCRQVSQPYGWPVAVFASDLAALVASGLSLVQDRLLAPGLAAEQRIQPLMRADEVHSCIAAETGDPP
jgi:DNA-binding LacI/PurR family transcriptional regulator